MCAWVSVTPNPRSRKSISRHPARKSPFRTSPHVARSLLSIETVLICTGISDSCILETMSSTELPQEVTTCLKNARYVSPPKTRLTTPVPG
jgi:predicted DNA-binding transcriptional regulator AlpA